MNRIINTALVVLNFIIPLGIFAQEKTFQFEDELCKYVANYDSQKFTEEQLKNTYKLVEGYYNIYTEDERQLDENYKAIKSELTEMKLVKSTYFEKQRDSVINFLDLTYKAKKAEFAARAGNKELLLNLYPENLTIKRYSEALYKGGSDLIKAYEYLTKEEMKSNGAPERLWSEYLKNIDSPNAQSLAFDYVLTYGWWNTVNNQLPHVNNDGTQFEQFKKLFIKIETVDCDEI